MKKIRLKVVSGVLPILLIANSLPALGKIGGNPNNIFSSAIL
jgi:hypothetical protein